MSDIDQRMRELRRELRGVSWRRRRRVLAEARDHLACALEDGLGEAEAVASLGRAEIAFAGFPPRRGPQRLAIVIGPAMLLALAPSLDGTFLRLGSGTAPSEAAAPRSVPLQVQTAAALRQCIATWNSEPSGRWRAVAAEAGIRRGNVSILEVVDLSSASKQAVPRINGCTVGLQRALVPSPVQRVVSVYATRSGRAFRFERMLRAHSRSAAPAANVSVSASGRLTLTSGPPPVTCPSSTLGSQIVSVVALPTRRALSLTGTTQLAARPSMSYVVTIRNTGRVAIQGAIASLEIGGTAHAGRAWWRSPPSVVRRLEPGVSVALRFTSPGFGHGLRTIQATTAAIACETTFADNSRVFHVQLT